ncbi:MAG TPA: ABC transporter substrate-binding protein [Candidatus Binatia bacterium]|jgi:putative ABC transport system substrate-binding protein
MNAGSSGRVSGSYSDNPKSAIQNPKLVGVVALVTTFAMCGVEVQAQQPKKFPRIGYLSVNDAANASTGDEGIRSALRELGYVEGQNIAIEYRYSEGRPERAAELAAELVRLKVDVIVAAGGPTWVETAKNATTAIPIVMVGLGADPVEAGLVKSLARPGGNVTGVTNLSRDLVGKRLELLKEAVPKVARVAVLYDPANPVTVKESKKNLQTAARALHMTIETWEVRAASEFEQVFASVTKWRPDGLYPAGGGPLLRANRKRIAEFALKHRLPSMANRRNFVEDGGLIFYGADESDSYRRVAYFVDKILKGAKPADLPVEQPTKFELVINLKTAKQIGLTIPPNVLARADKVIR